MALDQRSDFLCHKFVCQTRMLASSERWRYYWPGDIMFTFRLWIDFCIGNWMRFTSQSEAHEAWKDSFSTRMGIPYSISYLSILIHFIWLLSILHFWPHTDTSSFFFFWSNYLNRNPTQFQVQNKNRHVVMLHTLINFIFFVENLFEEM